MSSYDPKSARLLSFAEAATAFRDGTDTPRDYLERCLATIDAREPDVKAFTAFNLDGARGAADAATARYRDGRPLSPVDGMPVAVKDVFDTHDMPTTHNSDLFRGQQTAWDAACPYFFRRGGAAIVGKTVTTEFAFGTPGPARNPWDANRTPGGSSSGSGAAVGASMVPVAVGTQVRGSVLRPAAYCGTYALKPSKGAISTMGGFPSAPSMNCVGVLAGTMPDMWTTAWWLSQQGSDAGFPSIAGPAALPAARRPARLIRLETAGWAATDAATRAAFEDACAAMAAAGVDIVGRLDDPEVEALEAMLAELRDVIDFMLTYEARWPLMMYSDAAHDKLGERVGGRAKLAAEASPDRYADCLDWAWKARAQWKAFKGRADGFVTLNQTGPAPTGMPVGNTVYGEPSSLLGVPAMNLPVMAVDGMPVGLQLLGFYRGDADMTALGRWMAQTLLGD